MFVFFFDQNIVRLKNLSTNLQVKLIPIGSPSLASSKTTADIWRIPAASGDDTHKNYIVRIPYCTLINYVTWGQYPSVKCKWRAFLTDVGPTLRTEMYHSTEIPIRCVTGCIVAVYLACVMETYLVSRDMAQLSSTSTVQQGYDPAVLDILLMGSRALQHVVVPAIIADRA